MLSGAMSSAPRWSVVGLTGNATASSRGRSSRPPPDAAALTMEISRTPNRAVGRIVRTSVRRLSPSGRYAGSHAARTVIASMTPRPVTTSRRERPRRPAVRKRSSGPRSEIARDASAHRPDLTVGRSVEESAVDTGTSLPGHLLGGELGDGRPAAQHDRVLAHLDGELT